MDPTPLPNQLIYGAFKPKGYYTTFKQWPITPMSSNQYWTPDQIVRFLVTIKQGVMDPVRSHLSINVTVPLQMCPIGGMQVDSSAQSFISQTVLSSNNVEVERITEYDTLACYLTDIGFSQYVCQSRQVEGLGYTNVPTNQPWTTSQSSASQIIANNLQSPWAPLISSCVLENSTTGTVMPCRAPSWTGKGLTAVLGNDNTPFTLNSPQLMGSNSIAPSVTNVLLNYGNGNITQVVLNDLGRITTVRQQYLSSIYSSNYPDIPSSILQTSPQILNQTWTAVEMLGNNNSSGFNPKAPYQIGIPQGISSNAVNTSDPTYPSTPIGLPTTCNVMGFQKPYAAEFCKGTNEAILSPTIPQCQMQNGLILPSKVPVWQKVFRLPLISSICGILIPPQQFVLLPMAALFNLLLQITLSRWAMFTTGYSDVHECDLRGMQTPQQRKWLISDIAWNIHLYTFSDSYVNDSIQASLTKTIPISGTGYLLASQYQLPNGQVIKNMWPIGSQCQSLCQVICLFISNEYQQWPFCRKQFRLSNNINSMQIKYNTEFFPSQPIIGNAGNPQILDVTGDNWPFYSQLLLSNNYLFNTNTPMPKINMKNFAINARAYNVSNIQPFYPTSLPNGGYNFAWQSNTVNADTAMGMSHFHQNRYVGKAAFIYCWQPYGHSKNYMTGLNTQGVQNFSIIFGSTGKSPFPTDQTLLMFCRHNIIVVYSNQGVKVVGR